MLRAKGNVRKVKVGESDEVILFFKTPFPKNKSLNSFWLLVVLQMDSGQELIPLKAPVSLEQKAALSTWSVPVSPCHFLQRA